MTPEQIRSVLQGVDLRRYGELRGKARDRFRARFALAWIAHRDGAAKAEMLRKHPPDELVARAFYPVRDPSDSQTVGVADTFLLMQIASAYPDPNAHPIHRNLLARPGGALSEPIDPASRPAPPRGRTGRSGGGH